MGTDRVPSKFPSLWKSSCCANAAILEKNSHFHLQCYFHCLLSKNLIVTSGMFNIYLNLCLLRVDTPSTIVQQVGEKNTVKQFLLNSQELRTLINRSSYSVLTVFWGVMKFVFHTRETSSETPYGSIHSTQCNIQWILNIIMEKDAES